MSAESDRQNAARRNPDRMLGVLGHHFAWHQRTRIVNDTLERRLSELDTDAWYTERDFTINSVPIPFTVFGPGGLFLLMGTRGHWTAEHISLMHGAADTLAELTGYPARPHPAIIVLSDSREPRQEYTAPNGCGPCWTLGDYWLIAWLESFQDHGFSTSDVARLREYSDPNRICEPKLNFTPTGSG
jgi:hypothetical protein